MSENNGPNKSLFKKIAFYACIAIIFFAIILIVVLGTKSSAAQTDYTAAQETDGQEPIVRYVTKTETVVVDNYVPVEVEKEITTDILEEGLHDMGTLITQEYWFKEVTTFESTKTYAWVISANSKLVMGYEGVLLAGIDFTAVKVEKDDTNKIITVTLPHSQIVSCDLDLDSFEVYEEDVSKWNPITASDYNGSLKELESSATSRAIERGLLTNADSNAEALIRSFIGGLVDLDEYKIQFKFV